MKFLKPWLGNDVFRCLVCGRFAIAEEKDLHECRVLKEYQVEGNTCKAFDGVSWYLLKWDQVRPTTFDREKFRHRLDRTCSIASLTINYFPISESFFKKLTGLIDSKIN